MPPHFPNAETPRELEGLRVHIDRVVYMPEAQTPPNQPYAFAYFITIQNDSEETVTVMARKWVFRNDLGEITAVEGDGVVGEFPRLLPGEHFSYNSYYVGNRPLCWGEGSYLAQTEDGNRVMARIPKFEMRTPEN